MWLMLSLVHTLKGVIHCRVTMKESEQTSLVSEWYSSWHRLVLQALTNRLGRREDVQDLAQEVYLRLLRADRLDLVRHPKSYLYRVAANVAQEWSMRSQQSRPHSSEGLEEMGTADIVVAPLEQKQISRNVQAALKKLPLECRMSLVLHARDDMTYQQIADHMQVTRRMVKRYVATGYRELRKQMSFDRKPSAGESGKTGKSENGWGQS